MKRSNIIWLLAGALGLGIFILLFNHVFPAASIDLKLSKAQVAKKAEDFVRSQGFELSGFQKSMIFDSDDLASIYLQKNLGIKKTNELIQKGLPVWFWKLRWFKELQKEGFVVTVNPSSGQITRFLHPVLDDDKGVDLSEEQARAIAERVLASQGVSLNEYELKENAAKKQKQRTDYNFSWEKKDYKIGEATLRLDVSIYGDKLGKFLRHLKVPEGFSRDLEKEGSSGMLLAMVSNILIFLLMIAAVVVLIIRNRPQNINWKFGLISSGIVFVLSMLAFFNGLPLLWNFYPDTISTSVFMMISLGTSLIASLLVALMVFAYGSAGQVLTEDSWPIRTPVFTAIKNRDFSYAKLSPVFIVGYSLGFIFLGYLALFYLVGTRFFKIWMPADTEYSNILATTFPFLFPLTLALTASLSEEFMFRLFSISFFKKYLRLTWIAVLLPALIWAFAHSNYPVFPMYVRGIELTIFGVALGAVFLVYGLEAVIIAHFVIDAVLGGMPLVKSGNPYFVTSGVIVIILAFLPIFIMALAFKTKKEKI